MLLEFDSAWIEDFKLLPAVCLLTPKIQLIVPYSFILSPSLRPSLSSSPLTLSCCHVIYAVYLIPLCFPFLSFKLVKDSRPYVELELYLICLFQRSVHIFFLNLCGLSFLLFYFGFLKLKSLILVYSTEAEHQSGC